MEQNDSGILTLFAFDEEKAFNQMFERYYSALCVMAGVYTGNEAIAEDIVQQVFIGFWEKKCHHRVDSSLQGYLQSSVRNACINFLRKEKLIKKSQANLLISTEADEVFNFLLAKEEQLILEKAINELPVQCRKAFELVYFEELKYKDAAKNMDLSVNTIKTHLKNALRLLKTNSKLKFYYQVK
ncbi:MAG: RNA polymerase sigma-70 factor ECF subfamily [Bacteroidetes bacterium]|nr:MAG: RNA polymerase sigma-70 factor ECF subfamily [Bacteroidota bacterium]